MAELPDYYMDLGVDPKASQQEIEKVYGKRVAALRVSIVEDAPEELAEVEAAYAVLRDPQRRSSYDARVRAEDDVEDKKDAEMNASTANIAAINGTGERDFWAGFWIFWSFSSNTFIQSTIEVIFGDASKTRLLRNTEREPHGHRAGDQKLLPQAGYAVASGPQSGER
ncbi:MAG TPA: DnaJ domain-containing protein [Candidatus Angelobacter sp.]|nr:DnaJ domain-containing protein [Candidatus Angelobacter sp.]